jgi:hypothetical protein
VVRLEYQALDMSTGDGPLELRSAYTNSFKVIQIPA